MLSGNDFKIKLLKVRFFSGIWVKIEYLGLKIFQNYIIIDLH